MTFNLQFFSNHSNVDHSNIFLTDLPPPVSLLHTYHIVVHLTEGKTEAQSQQAPSLQPFNQQVAEPGFEPTAPTSLISTPCMPTWGGCRLQAGRRGQGGHEKQRQWGGLAGWLEQEGEWLPSTFSCTGASSVWPNDKEQALDPSILPPVYPASIPVSWYTKQMSVLLLSR